MLFNALIKNLIFKFAIVDYNFIKRWVGVNPLGMMNKNKASLPTAPTAHAEPQDAKNESVNGETTVRIRNVNTESKELSIMMIINLNSSEISFSKVDNDYRHIVAPLAHRTVNVRATVCVKPQLSDFRQLYFAVHLEVHKISDLLVGVELPNPVAAHN